MRDGRLVVGWAAVCLLAVSPLFAGEPLLAAAPEEEPPVTVVGEIQMRPELQAFSGVRGWLVNGQQITLDQVRDRALLYYGPYVLQDIVFELLLEQAAQREGVSVTEDEVNARIKQLREELGLSTEATFERYLRTQQKTRTWFEQKARDYALMDKMLSGQVYVSDRQVEAFYNQFRDVYRRQETVTFRMMRLLSEKDAQDALQELRKGRSFQEVAKEKAPTPAERAVAGEARIYERGQRPPLPPEFESTIFSAPLNQVVGPIKVLDSYYLARVEKKTDPRQFTLDDVRDVIRDQLRRRKLTEEVWPSWVQMQLSSAEIEVLKAE